MRSLARQLSDELRFKYRKSLDTLNVIMKNEFSVSVFHSTLGNVAVAWKTAKIPTWSNKIASNNM